MKTVDLMNKVESGLRDLADLTDEARTSDEVLTYLEFMAHFHDYSFYNTMSIYLHNPTATRVAGFTTWKKLGRRVRKGEKGIPILAPCFVRKSKQNDEDDVEKSIAYFKVVYVFDVSQTDGEPLPEAPITASCGDEGLLPILEQVVAQHGVKLAYKTMRGSHHGTSFGGRIEVDARLDEGGKVAVILHELAHELLHQNGRSTSRQQEELEAEAVAYVVSSHFGLKTASANYLALWDIPTDQITDVFKSIHRGAIGLIQDIQTRLQSDVG